jgi:peptide-methionine (R)-S-oxide reductase
VKAALILAAPVLAGLFFLSSASQTKEETRMKNKIMGWNVSEGRFVDGPYAGYLVGNPNRPDKIEKTEAEWREILTDEQYRILRTKGTEPAFCGVFHDNKKEGVYTVAGTGQKVFKSSAKFDSGTGWPSFWQAMPDAVRTKQDRSLFMTRTEVHCRRCKCHFGHIFDDGPQPTGKRHCINGLALSFKPDAA